MEPGEQTGGLPWQQQAASGVPEGPLVRDNDLGLHIKLHTFTTISAEGSRDSSHRRAQGSQQKLLKEFMPWELHLNKAVVK